MQDEEIRRLIEDEIKNHKVACAQVAIYNHGREVYYYQAGVADLNHNVALSKETIFRIYSMSKPVAAVAMMMLYERGLLNFNTPVYKYIPQFAHVRIWTEQGLVEPKSPVLVKDLLNMTSGISYPDGDAVGGIMEQFMGTHGVMQQKINAGEKITTLAMAEAIAKIPLVFQPGEGWRYGASADVIGAIIEIITGESLGEFYRKEIFEPLGMKDTGFYVSQEQASRLATLYQAETMDGVTELKEDLERHLCLTKGLEQPSFESAGAGLFSTVHDYSILIRMLAGGGCYEDVRLLKEESIQLFEKNQLTKKQLSSYEQQQPKGNGYGNLMRVLLEPEVAMPGGTVGQFGWDGWSGPYMWVDVKHEMAGLFMTQVSGYSNKELIQVLQKFAIEELIQVEEQKYELHS